MNKQTFVIIKPDAIERGFVGRIISRFEDMGLYIERIEKQRKNDDWCRRHYVHIFQTEQFVEIYNRLRASMTSQFTIGIILVGPNAIHRVREMTGETNALEALPGTIRGDWGKYSGCYNLIHAADSIEAAKREIELYFNTETSW